VIYKTTSPDFPTLFDVGDSLVKSSEGTNYYAPGGGPVVAIPAGRVPVQLTGGESDFDFAFRNTGIGAVALIGAAAGSTPVLSGAVRAFAAPPAQVSLQSPVAAARARVRARAIARAREILRARAASIRARYYRSRRFYV